MDTHAKFNSVNLVTMLALLVIATLFAIAPVKALFSGSDISNVTLQLPPEQTQLALPTDTTPTFVTLAVGIQNYTCGATLRWE